MPLEKIISSERLEPYKIAAGHDPKRTLDLYLWNMRLSAAFFPLICCAEIALRNLVAPEVRSRFGPNWWMETTFHGLLGGKGKGIVLRARDDIQSAGRTPDHGRIVAELTFGFWSNMLLPKYATPLWTQLHKSFPDLASSKTQADLFAACLKVRDLRNRISHHEPIFPRNISADYHGCMGLVSMLSRDKATWIKPHIEVMQVMRRKP